MQNELPVVQHSAPGSCCAGLWLLLAGLLGATGVAMGAFEAHGLSGLLESWDLSAEEQAANLHRCAVAIRFQMFHALALLALAAAAKTHGGRWLQVAGACWLVGTLLFSGLLYVRVFTGVTIPLIPAGGVTLIVGWVALAVGASFAMGCCRKP